MKATAVLLDIKTMLAGQAWDTFEMTSLAARECARIGDRCRAQMWDHAARASLDRHFSEVERLASLDIHFTEVVRLLEKRSPT